MAPGGSQGVSFLSDDIRFEAGTGDTVYRYSAVSDSHEFLTGLATSVTPRLTIDASGRVGVGTSTPLQAMDIRGGVSVFDDAGEHVSFVTDRFSIADPDEDPVYGYDATDDRHVFSTGGSARLSIEANGRVGIGTASPSSKLTVNGVIESKSGGVKFPDGTTQTSAAVAAVPPVQPGVASTTTQGAIDIGWGQINATLLTSQSITCPSNGYLVVIASGNTHVGNESVANEFRLDGTAAFNSAFDDDDGPIFSTQGVIPVTAGERLVEWYAYKTGSYPSWSLTRRMTVMFFPNAYGSITP
jgi:hypothetical protein